jgi:rhodanese-related sulfurtransferase
VSLLARVRAGVRARVEEAADRLVARALGQTWAPLRPPPERQVARRGEVAPPPIPEEPPVDVEALPPGGWLLDVREPHEYRGGVPAGATCVPMDLVPGWLPHLPRDRTIVVVCAAGARSHGVATWLRLQGMDAVSFAPGAAALPALGVPLVPVADAVGSRVRVPAGTDVDGALLAEELPGEVVAVTEGARWVRVDGGGSPVLVALAC